MEEPTPCPPHKRSTSNEPLAKRSNPDTEVTMPDSSEIPAIPKNDSAKEATTFKVFDVSPNQINAYGFEFWAKENGSNSNKIGKKFSKIKKLKCFQYSRLSKIIQGSQVYNQKISDIDISPVRNGFVDTIVEAYMHHHNLIIRPDDVWLAIITQFSFFVNANSEKLRGHFVDFKGQNTLTVKMMDPLKQYDLHSYPYDLFLTLMTDLVDKNLVDSKVKDWILPNFSTTTPDDRLTAGVTLMASMKNYFGYMGLMGICGIPNLTIEGSVEDWADIRNRIERLREYELGNWVDMLGPVLDHFVRTKSGDIDLSFWKNICHHDVVEGNMKKYIPDRTYIGGWATAFCPFKKNGKWQGESPKPDSTVEDTSSEEENGPKIDLTWPRIDIKDIAEGYVDVQVIFDIHETKYNTVIIAGHMAMEALSDRLTLRPKPGWVIALEAEKAKSLSDVVRSIRSQSEDSD